VDLILVAIIGALGGLASGLVVAIVRPWGDNWLEVQRERRARRRSDLDRLAAVLEGSAEPNLDTARIITASIDDQRLTDAIAKVMYGPHKNSVDEGKREAADRVGELRRRL
jgi:hypothetical protein